MQVKVTALSARAVLISAGAISAQHAAPAVAPPAVLELVRTIVRDSMSAGGQRGDQFYLAGTPVTLALLVDAALGGDTLIRSGVPSCPSGTTSTGAPVSAPVGFLIGAQLTAAPDSASWEFSAVKNCQLFTLGRTDASEAFGEGGVWQIQRVAGTWQIVASSKRWHTE